MDISYIAPHILINKSIATEEAFLAHARKVHSSLQRYHSVMGQRGTSVPALKASLEDLLVTMVRLLLGLFYLLEN
jgi:hypothetical protein